MTKFGGIMKFKCEEKDKPTEDKKLILLENLMKDSEEGQMRLLDLKVGSVTAVAEWKGKSKFGS